MISLTDGEAQTLYKGQCDIAMLRHWTGPSWEKSHNCQIAQNLQLFLKQGIIRKRNDVREDA